MATTARPKWQTAEDDSTWERIKAAFANDWEQTKADFGDESARNMGQDVDDTVKQMAGTDDAFENHEQAFRFGVAANRMYGSQFSEWNDDLSHQLSEEYGGDYEADQEYIRHAYTYEPR